MNIKPIGNRILLKPIKFEEKTASGIILSSSSANENSNTAEVIAIGNLEKFTEIKVGNKVIYSKFSGTEIKDKEENFVLINAEDVLAIVEE
ncbi:MAG: co-chaperone GroES [Fusobacterium sp.]|nr:co-chaperone GroES [Fusobacterium sp.]